MVIQYRKNNESLQLTMSTSYDEFYMKSKQVKPVKPVFFSIAIMSLFYLPYLVMKFEC